jgi:hypothetical protein
MGAVVVISFGEGLFVKGLHLSDIIGIAQIANLALSLLANILATSVIAVKAWCVPSRWPWSFHHFVDGTLMDVTHTPKGNTARP